MKKIFRLFLSSVVFCGFYSVSADTLSIKKALKAAFISSKEWAAHKADRDIAAAKYWQALMSLLIPNISGRIVAGRGRTNITTSPMLSGNTFRDRYESTTTNLEISARHNIFNGLSSTNSMLAASHVKTAAVHKLKSEEQNLILNVVNAYLEIWFCRRKLDAVTKMVENLKKTWMAQQSSMEAEMATLTEVAEAESKYQSAIHSKIAAETELMTAVAEFERMTGLTVGDSSIDLPEFNFILPKSVDELIRKALKSNSAVNEAKLKSLAAMAQLKAARGQYLPSVDVEVFARKTLDKIVGSENGTRRKGSEADPINYGANLTVTIPIITNQNGTNTYSQVEIANQEALKAHFTAEETSLKVKKECIVNWNKYLSAIAQIEASRAAVKSAVLGSDSNNEATDAGLTSNTDVWAKENNLLEARVKYAKSQTEKIIAGVTIMLLSDELCLRSILQNIRIDEPKKQPKKTNIALKKVSSKKPTVVDIKKSGKKLKTLRKKVR